MELWQGAHSACQLRRVTKEVWVAAMANDVIHDGCGWPHSGMANRSGVLQPELKTRLAPPRRITGAACRACVIVSSTTLSLSLALTAHSAPCGVTTLQGQMRAA